MKTINKRTKILAFAILSIILVGSITFFVGSHSFLTQQPIQATPTQKQVKIISPTQPGLQTTPGATFIASVDTMKESRDTETHPLSPQEILAIVTLSASINTNYITVDTNWDYPDYIQRWVTAIRATGRHVWFRSQPNQWENVNGASGTMTPDQYEGVESHFILSHPSLFQSGDIFDPCPEPEQGHYWSGQYGEQWTWNAPNTATRAYNAFIRDTTDVANAAFQQKGLYGVITTIHSTNTFFPTHPDVLEQATVNKLGAITIDSYPEESTLDPTTAANRRVDELNTIENLWHVPIIIGEMGYSNEMDVDDVTQQHVIKAELQAIEPLPYVIGLNYWVGAGTNTSGGYTHIFAKSGQQWSLRPAAYELAAFYKAKCLNPQQVLGTATTMDACR